MHRIGALIASAEDAFRAEVRDGPEHEVDSIRRSMDIGDYEVHGMRILPPNGMRNA